MKRTSTAALVALTLLMTVESRAEAQFGPQPPHQFFYQSTTVARLNPLGLITFFQFNYRKRLYQSNSIFFRDNYVGLGVMGSASPAFARGGLLFELQPLPFMRFWAAYEMHGYFGTFQFLPSFTDSSAPRPPGGDGMPGMGAPGFSDTQLREDTDRGSNYAATGTQLTLSATLQAKLGPAAIRSVARGVRPDYDLRAGDNVFYDIFFDMLIANRGWMWTNDLDIFYVHDDRFNIGIRYTWSRSFFPERAQGPREGGDGERPGMDSYATHRIGPVFAWTPWREYKSRFNGPTLIVAINWWVQHPYRRGQDVSAAFPYTIIGFSFQGDLLATQRGRRPPIPRTAPN
ncbi:MAG: hypothetical protein KF901_25735 [Myxococcales bacterium]|nr:hypothetical protein [Myxococcales bacterium]